MTRHVWWACALALALLGAAARPSELPDPATGGKGGGPLAVLFLKGNIEIGFGRPIPLDATLVTKLKARGYRLAVARDFQALTPAYLAQFNCVVWVSPSPYSGSAYFNPASWRGGVHMLTVRKNAEMLRRYVAAGGGLLINPALEEMGMSRVDAFRDLLKPYGLEPRCAQVRDPVNRFVADKSIGQFPLHFCWTEAVARHPATEGVRRIYYPDYLMRWDDNYTTMPLFPRDGAWTVLVRGMPGSVSAWKQGTIFEWGFWRAAEGWDAPPIVVARELGRGRAAAIGISHFHLFYFPYAAKKRNYWENLFGRMAGRLLEGGDGKTPSDLGTLLDNLYRWLCAPGVARGLGGYDAEKGPALPPIPKAVPPNVSAVWADRDPLVTGPVRPMKILVGARTAASDGSGTPKDYAEAAKAAGYDVVCFTETFEKLTDAAYRKLAADCERLTDARVALLPGLDVEDALGNRFLILGKRWPVRAHLRMKNARDPPGKTLVWTGHMLLGMGDVLPVAARPARNATVREQGYLPPDLYSHTPGFAIATYRGGRQVDDGLFAYRWHLNNSTIPIPVVVHEVHSPGEVAQAAGVGMQCYVNSDTPAHAAHYFHQGLESYGGNPMRYYVSSGPLVDGCGIDNWRSPHWTTRLKAHGSRPIAEVLVRDQRQLYRRFAPRAKAIDLRWHGSVGAQQWFLVELRDAAGGRAYLSPIRNLPRRYFSRCMDRQNFFGVGRHGTYTGRMRAYQGHARPRVPGVTLAAATCPLVQLTYHGEGCAVVEYKMGNTLVPGAPTPGIDSYPIFNAVPIPEYDAHVRCIFRPSPWSLAAVVATLRLKRDLAARGRVWPVIGKTAARARYVYTEPDTGRRREGTIPADGCVDLPAGGAAGGIVALTPLRVSGDGQFGFAGPGEGTTAKAGAVYRGSYAPVKGKDLARTRKALGFDGPPPYTVALTQGKLKRVALWMQLEAERGGVAGTIAGEETRAGAVPVCLAGANPRWPLGLWTADGTLRPCGFFDGAARCQLDSTKDTAFYFGNALLASDERLHLALAEAWTKARIRVEVHNPTTEAIEADVWTAAAIPDRMALKRRVTVPPGSTVYVEASAPR